MFRLQLLGIPAEVTELTMNIIAKSMNAKCDADKNEYLLLDALVDYHKGSKVISLTAQHMQVSKFAASGGTVLPHGRSCPS